MPNPEYDIVDFSPYLFWDFDRSEINTDHPTSQLVQRVLDYGVLKDWKILCGVYGFDKVIATATGLRNLDPRTLSFLVNISGVPKEKFRCYSTTQLMPQHWHF